VLPRSRDERCPSGSGWGEAPSTGLRLRSPGQCACALPTWATLTCRPSREAPDGTAGRPLARETSAGAGGSLPRRSSRGLCGRGKPASPGLGSRHGGWGLNFILGISPNPARAGRAATTGREPGIGRSRGCARGSFWLQKSTSGVWSEPRNRSGLAIRPRARVVKGRRKPARGGKAASTVAGSRGSRAPEASAQAGGSGEREARASAGEGREGGASRRPGTSRSGGVSTRRGKASWFRRSSRL
jgi:hypothetical protein